MILLLHLLSDVRRRAALATTATIVTVFATVAVVGTIATSASAAPHGASQPATTHVAQPEPRAVAAMPLTSRQQSRLPALRAATVPKPADGVVVPPAAAAGPVSPVGSASSAATAQNTTSSQVSGAVVQPMAPEVQLAAGQTQCQQGQWTFTVPSASVSLPKPAASDGALGWYWETRVDNGTAPSQPPVSSAPSSQPFHAGDTSVPFAPATSGQPLLSAPVGATYSYSIRLHITAPFDAASDWVSVLANTAACPGASTPPQQQ
ncbi:MAG TPA: hypothetical protein VFT53_03685 [Candidatus Saccharimonadales bacterium]|nr:hypothetical protein [Candidatus Saccharimonadales bacterium]